MYTLLSAGVLGLDLVRHPSGALVADVLDRVLVLQPGELAGLAQALEPGPERDAVRDRLLAWSARCVRATDVLPEVTTAMAGRPRREELAALGSTLTAALLGSLADLHALLLREEPLRSAPWAAQQAVLDAVTVAWAGRGDVELRDLALLREPWQRALAPLPAPLPDDGYGPGGAERVRSLLDVVARLTPDVWARVAAAHTGAWRGLGWSTAVHEGCRCALDAGRVVPVARAHLAAARALRLSGVSTTPHAGAAAMAVAAAVQATCTADLLEPGVRDALLAPWLVGTGPT